MAACSQLDSCERCVAQQPSRLDVGVRCVWCASLAACLEYTKHSFLFPCPDALRPGGGYPGGSSCADKHARPPESETHASVVSKPSGPPHFTYIARTAEPLTIVIASFGRPSNLPTALAYLLQLEPLGRAGSELIVSHGSRRSFLSAAACDAHVDAACAGAAAPGCYGATVRHLNSTMLNDRYYAAQRFFAAHEAANNAVVLHLDDDLVPTQPMLQALIDHVALEPGFPLYSAKEGSNFSPGLYGPSSFTRSCGPLGYTRGHQQVLAEGVFLSVFVQIRGSLATLVVCRRVNLLGYEVTKPTNLVPLSIRLISSHTITMNVMLFVVVFPPMCLARIFLLAPSAREGHRCLRSRLTLNKVEVRVSGRWEAL
ncbi:MAG: hypothetical protein SGPRY_011361 [Prymnesium sp.]